MSKQVYIDSEGNEIQVSGTVNSADMMPMSASDDTKVSEAIEAKMDADKIKTYNWIGTSVAITTLYSGGSMYYCDITFPVGEATDCNEILALTMVDYGGLSNVLQFQIRGSRTFRIWSKTSMTLSTLTVKVLYFT